MLIKNQKMQMNNQEQYDKIIKDCTNEITNQLKKMFQRYWERNEEQDLNDGDIEDLTDILYDEEEFD